MPTASSVDFTLGNKPLSFVLILSRDADFDARMRRKATTALPDPNWEPGTEITLVFTEDVTWAATIDDDLVIWHVDEPEVNDLIQLIEMNQDEEVELRYKLGTRDSLWGVGRVSIRA